MPSQLTPAIKLSIRHSPLTDFGKTLGSLGRESLSWLGLSMDSADSSKIQEKFLIFLNTFSRVPESSQPSRFSSPVFSECPLFVFSFCFLSSPLVAEIGLRSRSGGRIGFWFSCSTSEEGDLIWFHQISQIAVAALVAIAAVADRVRSDLFLPLVFAEIFVSLVVAAGAVCQIWVCLEVAFEVEILHGRMFSAVMFYIGLRWRCSTTLVQIFPHQEVFHNSSGGFSTEEVFRGLLLFGEERHCKYLSLSLSHPLVWSSWNALFPLADFDNIRSGLEFMFNLKDQIPKR